MTTPQHENAAGKIASFIISGLDKIQAQSQSADTIDLAENIGLSGTARIKGEDHSYQPDTQFRHRYPFMPKQPGLAVEVGWSQPWAGKEGLEKKLSDLLEVGGGLTRVVIGVDLRQSTSGTLKMSLSLWRLTGGSDILNITWDRVWDRVEIVPGDERILRLTLDDFISPHTSAEYYPGADLDTEILIPLGRVYKDTKYGFELWQQEIRKIGESDQYEARV